MTDERAQKRGTAHPAVGLIVGLLTLAWLGGTIGFMAAVVRIRFCLEDCEIDPHDAIGSDRLLLASVGCAVGFPLLATVICGSFGRKVAAILFVVLGVLPGVAYAGTAGIAALHEMRQLQVHRPAPPPPAPYCPCFSGGRCDCPGG
ncbi:hypothetical protein OG417_29345 [Actinoallomurus sp. NBC_01490]|uniref:hypothetical protein n=1 Tax=Actinoallomurus sp. NBC_01490 TaxID=2903557 RepID=UPI002E364F99|nr:hypothetical protein [Actinoallomurus sp. NBC_01490]